MSAMDWYVTHLGARMPQAGAATARGLRGGVEGRGGAAPALRAQTGAQVTDLVSSSQLGGGIGKIPQWRMAGVVGALLS